MKCQAAQCWVNTLLRKTGTGRFPKIPSLLKELELQGQSTENTENSFIEVLYKQKRTNYHLKGRQTGKHSFFLHFIIYIVLYIAQLYRVLHKYKV